MSVIDEALRKLEDERNQQARKDSGGEYMAAPRLEAPSTSNISRLLWMVLGGGVVAVVVLTWAGKGSERAAPVATVVAPVAAVASVAAVVPTPVPAAASVVEAVPTVPTVPAVPVVAAPVPAQPVVTLPVAPSVPPPVLAWQAPAWVRSAGALMSRGDRAGALQSWSQGLAKLSPKDALIVLPASVSDTAAVALYRSLSGQFPALLAQDNGALRVLLVPDAGEVSEVVADLRTQLKRKALKTTTVAAWRAELDVLKLAKSTVAVPVQPAAVAMAQRPAPPLVELESVSSAQGTANSSAAEILRRFTAVERMLSQGQFDSALTAVGQVEAELGETWQTSYLKGTAAQGLRRWDEAIAALTRAHQQNPASMKVLLNRAICLQEIGKHEGALEDLRQATALSPGTPELVANSAYSLDALGRPADALAQYQKFLEMTAGRDEYAKLRAWASKRVVR
jgi:tetratricopeptide (TPR) repeat protein